MSTRPEDMSPDRGVRRADPATRRRTLSGVVVGVVALVLVAVPLFAAWQMLFVAERDVPAGQPVQVEIREGSGTAEIGAVLARAGVIDNAAMFRVRARLQGVDDELRPGVYDLHTGMSYPSVLERLLEGPPLDYVTVTIPEGFTVEQIAVRFEELVGIPATDFKALALGGAAEFSPERPYLADVYEGSLEGYLFPKTYRVLAGASARDVIEMMLDQFDSELAAVDLSAAAARGLSLHETVTLASMIERETRIADERVLVSSVIHNRLAIGMHLEIDATIEYVIKKNRPRLLNRDLKVESPFNTYKYAGLPPGPIASPGLASLQAAVAPAQTDYMYYVLTSKDGSHTFCVTLEEFLIAKEKSREVTP